MTNGKAKGSSYEREISKQISLWLTEGRRDDTVWRTSNSGGKASVTNSDTQCGDLHSVRKESEKFFNIFSIECKNYRGLNPLDFTKKNFLLYKWWGQATKDADRANKIPLLVIRINRKGDWLVFDEKVLTAFFQKHLLRIPNFSDYRIVLTDNVHTHAIMHMYPLDFLFKNFNLKEMS